MRLENLFIAALENDFNDKEINLSPKIKPIREVSSDCKKGFKEELLLIQRRHLTNNFKYMPIVGCPVLSTRDIEEVLQRLNGITNYNHIKDLVPDEDVGNEILDLVYDFFRDISVERITDSGTRDIIKNIPDVEESYFLDSASDTSDSDETDFIDYISSSLVDIDE